MNEENSGFRCNSSAEGGDACAILSNLTSRLIPVRNSRVISHALVRSSSTPCFLYGHRSVHSLAKCGLVGG